MTTNTPSENNIDSLADRAKEMLERVRGSADVDSAVTPTPVQATPTEADSIEDAPSEAIEEATIVDEIDVVEETAIGEETAVEAETLDEIFEESATPDPVDVDTADVESADDEHDTNIFAETDTNIFADTDVDSDSDSDSDTDVDLDTDTDTDTDSDSDTDTDTDTDTGIDVNIEDAPQFGDESNSDDEVAEPTASGSRLSMLAGQAKESLDNVAGTTTAASADEADDNLADELVAELETIDVDGDLLELDEPGIDLPDIPDLTTESVDINPDPKRTGYLGEIEEVDVPTIDVDDLTLDETIEPADLDVETPTEDDDGINLGVIAGSAIVAGGAVVAGNFGSDTDDVIDAITGDVADIDVEVDLDVDVKPVVVSDLPPSKDFGVLEESELRKLVVEPADTEPRNARAFSWLVPLAILAIAVLALVWWLADLDATDSGTSSVDSEEVELDGTGDNPVTTEADPVDTATTTANTTSTSETTTPPTTIPASAWSLMGADSNTALFAELGSPLGLQAALEQQFGADGTPLEFTLLAPSDSAIAALSDEQLTQLAEDRPQAAALIDYHFIDQKLTPELLAEAAGSELITRSGLPISVELDGEDVVLNGTTRIALESLVAENGNVLVIDNVLQPPSINTVLDLGNIQFEPIQSVITPAGQAELQKAVTFFMENPDANALIEGHTDTDGDAVRNLSLSERRATAVREFLIAEGIDGSRLVAEGFGETRPILVDGVEDKNASRRIAFILR